MNKRSLRQTINLFYSDRHLEGPSNSFKKLKFSAFPKKFVHYLLSEQQINEIHYLRGIMVLDRETARRLGREQWETACLDRWPFWVVRMPAYGLFHLDENVHPPIKCLVISYWRVPTDWTIIFSAKQNQHIKEVLTGALSILNIRWENRAIVLKPEQEMANLKSSS